MRKHGPLSTAAGLGLRDHACWAFDDRAELRAAGTRYLADGRALRQRLMYVGTGSEEALREDLAALADRDALIEAGWLSVLPLEQVYDAAGPLDCDARLATYDALVDDALAEGYSGLRVLAEVTALLADPARAADHARWEAVADRYMDARPLSALCCYERRGVDGQALADVACVHPLANGPDHLHPFRLYARDGGLALAGEVDFFSADALARALTASAAEHGETVLDLAGLEFIDIPAVRVLRATRRRLDAAGRPVTLRAVPASLRRLERLLAGG